MSRPRNRKRAKKKQQLPPLFDSSPIDLTFFALVLIILCVGLVMMFSASHASAYFTHGDSYHYIKKQAAFAVIGLIIMFLVSKINYFYLKFLAIPAYGISLILLILVLVIGTGKYDEKRWLDLGLFNVQPSEVAKIGIILMLSLYISRYYKHMKGFVKGILIPGILIGAAAILIILEPHMSGTVLVLMIGLILMIIGGSSFKYLTIFGSAAMAGLIYVLTQTDYMTNRIEIWRNPGADPQGGGFQTLQSLYAVGSGGLFGLGLGKSRQKYLYIPEPQNDFIFAIVCEELGFIGAVAIIGLFVLLIYRGFIIAMRSPDKFGALVVYGIMSNVAVQTLLNIAVVTNAIPVTGISLPFFSYGGSALLILLAEMGIVLAVSRKARLEKG